MSATDRITSHAALTLCVGIRVPRTAFPLERVVERTSPESEPSARADWRLTD